MNAVVGVVVALIRAIAWEIGSMFTILLAVAALLVVAFFAGRLSRG